MKNRKPDVAEVEVTLRITGFCSQNDSKTKPRQNVPAGACSRILDQRPGFYLTPIFPTRTPWSEVMRIK